MNLTGRGTLARRSACSALMDRIVTWKSILACRAVVVDSVLIRRTVAVGRALTQTKVRSNEEIPVWSHSGRGCLRDFLQVRRRRTRPYLVWAGSVTEANHSPTLTPERGSLEGGGIYCSYIHTQKVVSGQPHFAKAHFTRI